MSYRSLIPPTVQAELAKPPPPHVPKVSPLGYSGFVCHWCRAAVDIAVRGDHPAGCPGDPGDTPDDVRAWSRAENEQRAARKR